MTARPSVPRLVPRVEFLEPLGPGGPLGQSLASEFAFASAPACDRSDAARMVIDESFESANSSFFGIFHSSVR